ncbi:MAG: DUF4190 domain-containing protein [Oscillospiraceae bacterium]|nr:DUF4190 domain-containing protein [Oscillospiraceae bacterium]
MGIASLVLGILGILNFYGGGLVLGGIGLVLGIIAKKNAEESGEEDQMAKIGFILSIIAVAISAVSLIFWVGCTACSVCAPLACQGCSVCALAPAAACDGISNGSSW